MPGKTVDVLRDLVQMYESLTIDDIYEAVDHFNLDDNNVFTCIGVSGKEPPVLLPFEVQNAANLQDSKQSNNGTSRRNKNNNGSKPVMDPRESANAVMSALRAAAQSGQLAIYLQGSDERKSD